MIKPIPELKDYILEGRAILLLGQSHLRWSNTSLDLLIPQLLSLLKKDLPKTEIARGFYYVCEQLLSKGVTNETLSDMLQRVSGLIPVNDNLRLITKTPWRAIFTTAIDNVLGRALQETQRRFIRNIYEKDRKLTNPRDPNNLYVIRLMGAIDQIAQNRMPPFTSFNKRKSIIRNLLDHIEEIAGVEDAIVVVAGFNPQFENAWICSQIWERIDELPQNSPSYWFETRVDKTTDNTLNYLIDQFKLEVKSNVDLPSFLGQFEKEIDDKHQTPEERTVNTRYGFVTFSESQWRLYQQHMVVLNETAIKTKPLKFSNPDEKYERFRGFLRAEQQPDWSAHASGFVFYRPVMGSVEALSLKMLRHGRSKHNSVITVSGPSGCGKTVILEHLAWRLAGKAHPVVYLPKRPQQPDFKVIDSFCQAVQPKTHMVKGAEDAVRIVVIWDSLAADPNRYNALASYLASQGRPALIIGSTFAPSKYASGGLESDDSGDEIQGEPFKLINRAVSTHLTAKEADNFVKYLKDIDPDLLLYLNETNFTEKLTEDFLVALYDHIPDLREKLATGARIQYRTYEELLKPRIESLFDEYKKQWKDLLPLVFVPSQFGCYPNLELVLDGLGEGYRELWLKEDKSNLLMDGLLYEDRQSGILRLRARNSRVAKISLMGRLFVSEQIKYLSKLARAVRPKFLTELHFLQELFLAIRNATREDSRTLDFNSPFKHYQRELAEILKEFREKEEDPRLMHTEAILLRRSADLHSDAKEYDYENLVSTFEEAIQILERALEILNNESEYERPEAEKQNIANSIAATYRDLIRLHLNYINDNPNLNHTLLKQTIEEEQLMLISYCDRAAYGAYPNIHEVDVYVTNLLNRYNKDQTATEEQKQEWAVEMLEELDRAQQSFFDNDLTTILNTRVLVEDALHQYSEQRATIEELQKRGSLSGFYLKARSDAYRYDRNQGKFVPTSKEGLLTGFKTLRELNPTALFQNAPCLSLHNRLWWDIQAPNSPVGEKRDLTVGLTWEQWTEYSKLLQQQLTIERERGARTMFLKFMLAWSLLQIGESQSSIRLFRELERQSFGSKFRIANLVRLSDENGKAQKFLGDVVEISDERSGYVYCPSLRFDVPFRRYAFEATPQKGDPLDFEIMLNYRGPLAVPLK